MGANGKGPSFFLLLQIFQKRSAYHRVGGFGKGKAQGSAAGGLKGARYHPRAAEGLHHQTTNGVHFFIAEAGAKGIDEYLKNK